MEELSEIEDGDETDESSWLEEDRELLSVCSNTDDEGVPSVFVEVAADVIDAVWSSDDTDEV